MANRKTHKMPPEALKRSTQPSAAALMSRAIFRYPPTLRR
jgi:hypothetical protein